MAYIIQRVAWPNRTAQKLQREARKRWKQDIFFGQRVPFCFVHSVFFTMTPRRKAARVTRCWLVFRVCNEDIFGVLGFHKPLQHAQDTTAILIQLG